MDSVQEDSPAAREAERQARIHCLVKRIAFTLFIWRHQHGSGRHMAPRATCAVNRQAMFARVVEFLFALIAKMTVAVVAFVFHRSSTTWSHLGRPLGPHCLGLCQQQQQLFWSLLLLSVCAASCQSAFTEESLFNLQFIFLLPTPS